LSPSIDVVRPSDATHVRWAELWTAEMASLSERHPPA
jgi:hypothetical protein